MPDTLGVASSKMGGSVEGLMGLLLVLFAPVALILFIIWMSTYSLAIDLTLWLWERGTKPDVVHLGTSLAADLHTLDPCMLGQVTGAHYETIADNVINRMAEHPRLSTKEIHAILREEVRSSGCNVSPLRLRLVAAYVRRRVDEGLLV